MKIFIEDKEELYKWTKLWFAIICVAFIIPSFLGLVGIVLLISYIYIPKENSDRVVIYFLLLPIIAARIKYSIDYVPGINYLIQLNYPELLILFILFPALIKLINGKEKNKKFKLIDSSTDFYVLSFFIVVSALQMTRQPTITASLREVFIQFMHIIIPYYAISRSVTSLGQFHKIFKAIVFSAVLVACVGVLEQITKWSFFSVLPRHLGVPYDRNIVWSSYRSGFMRTKSLLGEEIPLGLFLMSSLGATFYFRHSTSDRKLANFSVYLLLGLVIFLTDSRGTQLGAIALVFIYMLITFKNALFKLMVIFVSFSVLIGFSLSDVSLDSIDQHGTFMYRVDLVKNSMSSIDENFWFGSNDFWESEDLERSRQGQGIIDIVNTFLYITLSSGVVGFTFFSLIFISSIRKVLSKIKQVELSDFTENKAVGAVLASIVFSIMLVIITVSSVGHIPFYYWAFFGLSSAYCQLSFEELNKKNIFEESRSNKIDRFNPGTNISKQK